MAFYFALVTMQVFYMRTEEYFYTITPNSTPIPYPANADNVPISAISSPCLIMLPLINLALTAPPMHSTIIETTIVQNIEIDIGRNINTINGINEPAIAENPT